jgi:hypothetical protein
MRDFYAQKFGEGRRLQFGDAVHDGFLIDALEHVQFRWKLIMLQILCLVAFSTENRYPLFLKMR